MSAPSCHPLPANCQILAKTCETRKPSVFSYTGTSRTPKVTKHDPVPSGSAAVSHRFVGGVSRSDGRNETASGASFGLTRLWSSGVLSGLVVMNFEELSFNFFVNRGNQVTILWVLARFHGDGFGGREFASKGSSWDSSYHGVPEQKPAPS